MCFARSSFASNWRLARRTLPQTEACQWFFVSWARADWDWLRVWGSPVWTKGEIAEVFCPLAQVESIMSAKVSVSIVSASWLGHGEVLELKRLWHWQGFQERSPCHCSTVCRQRPSLNSDCHHHPAAVQASESLHVYQLPVTKPLALLAGFNVQQQRHAHV